MLKGIMNKIWLLATLVALCPGPGLSQTMEDLINDGKNTENVLIHSMGYDRKSYSPLKQINQSNVKRLVPIWSTSLMNDSGELAAPANGRSNSRSVKLILIGRSLGANVQFRFDDAPHQSFDGPNSRT